MSILLCRLRGLGVSMQNSMKAVQISMLIFEYGFGCHDHLHCWYVWNYLKVFAGLPRVSTSLDLIVDAIIGLPKRKSVHGIIARLVFAASTYFIWQERNNRLFKNQRRSHSQLIECIKSLVHLKLLTCSFKKTRNVMAFVHLWKLPDSLIILDS
ncbi:hypothetical protein Tco_1437722 [Tanacetum coccineum]